MNPTRRDWMLAAACWDGLLRAQPRKFAYFDDATAAEIEAIAARIIPDDETPGPRAAGVIRFIDGALAGYDEDKRGLYQRGLAEAQARRAELFPRSASISSLTAAQQDALLKAVEKTEFFRQVRVHAVLGFFGHPMYGGNRGMAGWKLIGLDGSMTYQPPFGYYYAKAAKP